MNRRDSLKALAVGTVSVGTLLTSCDKKEGTDSTAKGESGVYGRTPEETLRDEKLLGEKFFTAAEYLKTIAQGVQVMHKLLIS